MFRRQYPDLELLIARSHEDGYWFRWWNRLGSAILAIDLAEDIPRSLV